MNLIDNGIEEVINVERVIKDEEMYFLVTFKDYYGAVKVKQFNNIKNLENKSWSE